jgi:hypothetical protein
MVNKKDKTIVNVLGLQRSGTTMLHLMLGSGPNVIACGEIGGWFRIARHRPGSEPPEKFLPLRNVLPEQFHRVALRHFGVDFIVDSTKGFEWALDVNRWAKRQHLRVFNILIWKEPTDQVYSFWKRGENSKLWRYNWYHRRLMRAGIDFFTVSYSELVDNPSAKLQEICWAIGMPYFEGKERFWEENHAFAGSSQGVRNQVQRGNSRIQKEPKPPEFSSIATEIRREIHQNPKLRETLSFLRAHEITNLELSSPLVSHEYDPSLVSRLEHYFWKYIKNTWLRLRWNLLETWMGSHIRKLRRFLFPSPPPPHAESFDPDASR